MSGSGCVADDLWIKRDDWIGHGGGGNKLRKLEYLCARAQSEHATAISEAGRSEGLILDPVYATELASRE